MYFVILLKGAKAPFNLFGVMMKFLKKTVHFSYLSKDKQRYFGKKVTHAGVDITCYGFWFFHVYWWN